MNGTLTWAGVDLQHEAAIHRIIDDDLLGVKFSQVVGPGEAAACSRVTLGTCRVRKAGVR